MALARKALPDAAAAGLVALLVLAFFGHAFLNYDTFYALVWGDDLASGRTPQYEVPVAPTPHPLAIAVGALVSPLGDAAEDVLLGLVLLSIGALAVGLCRLGRESFARPVGVLAAAIFLTRVPPLNFGIRGYVDLPAIALIVWAAVLEARRPRRGAAVLVLLGLAGLLRPEAWLFAGAYWLWLAPPLGWPARLRLLALAAAAPLLWALSDLLVTGDPLWSLNGTSDLAADLGRPRGLDDVPRVMPRRLGEIMRLPELLAAVGGFAAGLAWLRRRAAVPAAVLVLNGVAFLVLAVGGLSLIGRYLFLAGAMLSLFAAVAALGWLALPEGDPRRRVWRAAGVVTLVAFAAFAPAQARRLDDLRDDVAARDRVQADLRDLVRQPAAERALDRCGRLFVPNHRPVPSLAYWTGLRPADVVSAARERPTPDGLFVAPATPEAERLSILDPRDRTAPAARPSGYRELARNRSWVLYGGCRLGP
ncbi:MAG TPA: hypothetical protein VF520_05240 [Thermoleophilaceae bacterium]|jgi:hypothetical protein